MECDPVPGTPFPSGSFVSELDYLVRSEIGVCKVIVKELLESWHSFSVYQVILKQSSVRLEVNISQLGLP